MRALENSVDVVLVWVLNQCNLSVSISVCHDHVISGMGQPIARVNLLLF